MVKKVVVTTSFQKQKENLDYDICNKKNKRDESIISKHKQNHKQKTWV